MDSIMVSIYEDPQAWECGGCHDRHLLKRGEDNVEISPKATPNNTQFKCKDRNLKGMEDMCYEK
jgi:hypothetical protein